ncbi:hypothetical protein [Streptomyces sp. NPDC056061]|uniref:hypothetical protein n=1 Tax=Streptomyces sp. NPDC056061 TaxID=3345700 RepID=UPI0035D8E135
MAQTKFDKQVEESAESLALGIGRVLADRDLDSIRRTDATFWRAGTRVLPGIEGRVRRRSYRAGWRRFAVRTTLGAAVAEGGYLLGRGPDATARSLQSLWENRDQVVAALEAGGIGTAPVLAVGGAAYGWLSRERRELMREWALPLHEALALPLRLPEQTDPRRYLHIPRNFSEDDTVIRVDVPGRLDFSNDLVADIIATKLALEGFTFSWHLAGRETYVTVKKTRKPPAKPAFRDPRQGSWWPRRRSPRRSSGSVPAVGSSPSTWTRSPRTSWSTPPRAAASR